MEREQEVGPAWAAVLLFFLLPPVGIGCLIHKVNAEKTRGMENGKLLRSLGTVLLIMAFLGYLLAAFAGARDEVLTMLLMFPVLETTVGLALVIWGTVCYRNGAALKRYLNIVQVGGKFDIGRVAEIAGDSYGKAAERMQQLLDLGMLQNAYLDLYAGKLITPGKTQVAFRCGICGGVSLADKGAPRICSYCGTEVKA